MTLASLRDAEPKEPVVDDEGGDEVFTKKPKTPTRKLSRTGTWLKPKVANYLTFFDRWATRSIVQLLDNTVMHHFTVTVENHFRKDTK